MSWLLSVLSSLWMRVTLPLRRLLARPSRKRTPFKYQIVDEFPEHLGPNRVYLAGEGQNLWAAAMICPCGCGQRIELNLLKAARPCWRAQLHQDGSISLAPSVQRQKGCRSHFVLSEGRIDWC
jgi:hypothetical protein